jgi:hypothetical protein
VRPLGLPATVAAGFLAALVCLLARTVVTVTFEKARDDQARHVARASATLLSMEHLERTVQNMATTTGALVHGAGAWAGLAEGQGISEVRPALDALDALVAAERELQPGFARLRAKVLGLAETAEQVGIALAGGRREEAERLAAALGPAAVAQLSDDLEQLEALERQHLTRHEDSWRSTARIGFGVSAAATLALALLMALAARIVRDEIRERERLSGELGELV